MCLATLFATASPIEAIVGGGEVGSAPSWMVAFVRPETSTSPIKPLCGGALVASTWIITTKHCVDDFDKKTVAVIGRKRLTTGAGVVRNFTIADVVKLSGVDIALVPIPKTTQKPLGVTPYGFSAGSGNVYGWGCIHTRVDDELCRSNSNNLKFGGQVLRSAKGDYPGPYRQGLDLWYSAEHASACNVDSGGPFVMNLGDKDWLVGVHSVGIKHTWETGFWPFTTTHTAVCELGREYGGLAVYVPAISSRIHDIID